MEFAAVMEVLEASGTERNRKVYRRHGMPEPLYGAGWAKLRDLHKRIGTDHGLALRLWDSGNADARLLATMVADPSQMDGPTLEAWAAGVSWYGLADQLACLAARSPVARQKRDAWIRSRGEWVARAGWGVLAQQALHDAAVPDAELDPYLAFVEENVHGAMNRVRDAMMTALVSVGIRSDAMAERALAAARRIGKVEVDHGETGCRTPDPLTTIPKARAHRRAKEAKADAGPRRPSGKPAARRPRPDPRGR